MTIPENGATDRTGASVRRFIDGFLEEPLAKKYLFPYTWLSGSSTEVSPVEIYAYGGGKFRVTFQWNSAKRVFSKFIDRIVQKYSPLVCNGRFVPNDGSCPAEIIFYIDTNKELGK